MLCHDLELLSYELAICRLGPDENLPEWALPAGFFSLARTDDELSVVCPQDLVPPGIEQDGGWRGLKVCGPLDLSQVGVLASLAQPLAEAGITIFAVSTYETDYILVREDDLEPAVSVLRRAGHRVEN
jgi:hypothetical protein